MFWEKKDIGGLEEGRFPAELNHLFTAYRDSLPDPEPNANFTPALWSRIEAKRKATYRFTKVAKAFVTAGATLCLLIGSLFIIPHSSPVYSATYVDVLADEHPDDAVAVELVHGDGNI